MNQTIEQTYIAYSGLKTFREYVENNGLNTANLLVLLQEKFPELYQTLRGLRYVLEYYTFQRLKQELDYFHRTTDAFTAIDLIEVCMDQLLRLCKMSYPCNEKPTEPHVLLPKCIYCVVDASIRTDLEDDDLYELLYQYDVDEGHPVRVLNSNTEAHPVVDSSYVGLFKVYSEQTFLKFRERGVCFGVNNLTELLVEKPTPNTVSISAGTHLRIDIQLDF